MPRVIRRIAIGLALAALSAGAVATPAAAATLPPRAEVRVRGRLDIAAFERIVATRYHVRFRKVVATDIDRDGDLDFVAATDRSVIVWVNDGDGHLTSQLPARAPAVDGQPAGTTWDDREAGRDEPLQDDVPSVPLARGYAHAPPIDVAPPGRQSDAAGALDRTRGCRTPRAPPA